MIECPASGALDLELGDAGRSGQQSVAVTATDIFQHLQSLMNSARLRPARASSEGLGWLAGYICDLAACQGVTAPWRVALSFP